MHVFAQRRLFTLAACLALLALFLTESLSGALVTRSSQPVAVWLSRDPLRNAEFQQGANLYSYVLNGPVDRIDRDGRFLELLEKILSAEEPAVERLFSTAKLFGASNRQASSFVNNVYWGAQTGTELGIDAMGQTAYFSPSVPTNPGGWAAFLGLNAEGLAEIANIIGGIIGDVGNAVIDGLNEGCMFDLRTGKPHPGAY